MRFYLICILYLIKVRKGCVFGIRMKENIRTTPSASSLKNIFIGNETHYLVKVKVIYLNSIHMLWKEIRVYITNRVEKGIGI